MHFPTSLFVKTLCSSMKDKLIQVLVFHLITSCNEEQIEKGEIEEQVLNYYYNNLVNEMKKKNIILPNELSNFDNFLKTYRKTVAILLQWCIGMQMVPNGGQAVFQFISKSSKLMLKHNVDKYLDNYFNQLEANK
ncbi:hypothetical protein ABK040_003431 [Willaertia magna]